jgi:hypothetical protein
MQYFNHLPEKKTSLKQHTRRTAPKLYSTHWTTQVEMGVASSSYRRANIE